MGNLKGVYSRNEGQCPRLVEQSRDVKYFRCRNIDFRDVKYFRCRLRHERKSARGNQGRDKNRF